VSVLAGICAAALAVAGCGNGAPAAAPTSAAAPPTPTPAVTSAPPPTTVAPTPTPPPTTVAPTPTGARPQLPQGGRTIFPAHRVVAYYGTAGNAALGVLGEAGPDAIMPRLRAAAAGFATRDRKLQLAYELIATVAQAGAGADGMYRKMIDPAKIRQYVEAARRNKVLVILDVQPGRSDFLTEVRKLEPYLIQPHVGVALDPEWRMGPNQVPGKVIGTVTAAEVNAVSAYVAGLVKKYDLPEKIFILHQFRGSMITSIGSVQRRPGLAMVQHLDGFGTRTQKDATFRALVRPQQFHVGYKLFYDEDVNIYRPRDLLAMRPTPEYISYQ
jgi:hypothetical protein